MSKIEQTGTAFAKAIADEFADFRATVVTKDDLREALKNVATKDDLKNFARELINVINANTLTLRNDLNREFERAGVPVLLDVTPRRQA